MRAIQPPMTSPPRGPGRPAPFRRPAPRPTRAPASDQGLAARRAALALIDAALARRAGMEDAASGLGGLEPRDRAFARALASETLRRKGSLDHVLAARLQRPPPEPVRALLRLGLAQTALLDTPAHAAVSTTLALAEADRATRPFKGLLNGVLRGIERDGAAAALDAAPPLSDLPEWLAARWRTAWGEATLAALAARLRETPPTDLALRDPTEAEALAAELEGVVLPGGALRTARRADVATWPGYDDGRWWVQDYAAGVPVRLLAPRPGETALDLCAAPGGKTLQLSAAGAQVTALDKSAPRSARIAENLARTRLQADLITADAGTWTGGDATFDAVLLDAPCTATGTFRRHPDVLWTARAADVASLAQAQARLLDAAAARVAPGGRLVYCVCSLEREEGEDQMRGFLSRHAGFRLTPADPAALGLPASATTAEGALRLLPSFAEPAGGLDGFFIARFDRAD
jgi:16S rRNA (cytosine967-C5)-methyltransferase